MNAADRDGDVAGRLLQRMQESQAEFVQAEFCDFIGVSRCRMVRSSAIGRDRQPNFPYVNIAHDVSDGEPDPEAMGPHTGAFWLSPDVASYVPLPYLSRMGSVMCWLTNPDGSPYGGCARTRAQHLAEALAERGIRLRVSFEPEGHTLVRLPGGQGWEPVSHGGIFTPERIAEQHSFIDKVVTLGDSMALDIEKVSMEAEGMLEFNLPPQDPVAACDAYIRFRQLFKAVAREFGWTGTFMPRAVTAGPTAGLHIHLSLAGEHGRDLCTDPASGEMTGLCRSAIAGILVHAEAVVAACCNSVNSYKRLTPDNSWAPSYATWGVNNRLALVRVVEDPPFLSGSGTAARPRRLEFRAADGTCNPYVTISAVMAAMLAGLDEGYDLEPEGTQDWGGPR
jgi:glutamine synthetase